MTPDGELMVPNAKIMVPTPEVDEVSEGELLQ